MSPEDREFAVELRRHLVGIVGLLERYAGIEPSCRVCSGCARCESLHRQQQNAQLTKRAPLQMPARGSQN